MNQVKIGKFISDIRKEKQMTQEQLAEVLNVDRTTISKWERGVNAPDISILHSLCKTLDISIDELIHSQRKKENKYDDRKIVEALKYYTNRTKRKCIFIFVLVFFIILSIFITSFTVTKNNLYEIYEIKSNSEDFYVSGYYFESKNRAILLIKDIGYNDRFIGTTKELVANSLNITLSSEQNLIYKSSVEKDETVYISDLLNNVFFYYDSSKSEEKIIEIEKSKLVLQVEAIDAVESKIFKIKLDLENKK